MREKLKREIRPLLSCNKGKTPQEIEAEAQQKKAQEAGGLLKAGGLGDQTNPSAIGGRDMSKRLNEFGNDILSNNRMVSEPLPSGAALGNYAGGIARTQTSVVGSSIAGQNGNPHNALLSQSNVSHSALVNSGNAAILGLKNNLNSLNLNSNNNNLMSGGAA